MSRAAGGGTVRRSIRELKSRAARKVPGSSSYRKLWRHYCHRFAEDVRDELLLRNENGPVGYSEETETDAMRATRRLEHELGATGANRGVMPDFSDGAALRGYTLRHFGRVRLLGDFLTQTRPSWLESRVEELFSDAGREDGGVDVDEPRIDLVSLGGGPGYDFVAAAALSEYRSGPPVSARVYDYEPRWESVVLSMEGATRRSAAGSDCRHRCDFARCDVTLPLSATANAKVAESANVEGDIFACSYCVAENAVALRDGGWAFFRDLFEEAGDGALFFVTDTTHRLWPELAGVAKDAGLRYATPHLRSGKAGWHFVALKDTSHPEDQYYSTAVSEGLMERFKADNAAHLNRLERGWKRESRKIKFVERYN